MLKFRTECKVTLVRDSAGVFSPLTKCCEAAATGVSNDKVVCKGCYEIVDPIYGLGASLAMLPDMLSEFGCPVSEGCAEHADWHFDMLEAPDTRMNAYG